MNVGVLVIIVGFTVLYCLIGTVFAGIYRRYLTEGDRRELDEMLAVFVMVWPTFLLMVPMSALYRRISGKN